MKLRSLTLSLSLFSLLGLGVMLGMAVSSWQSLREDLDQADSLAETKQRASELKLGMNHLLHARPGPEMVTAVRGEIAALHDRINEIAHPTRKPALAHLTELDHVAQKLSGIDNTAIGHIHGRSHTLDVAMTQIDTHQSGLSAALKAMLNDRQASIRESVLSTMQILSFLALLLAGLSFFALSLIHRRIRRPIDVLQESIRSMREGDLEARAPDLGRDEFGELARSFNAMAEVRQDHERRIDHYQQRLQESVRELQELAYRDQMTGALSRKGFIDRLSAQIDEHTGMPQGYLVAINIKGMRDINETRGYSNGDRLLRDVTEHLHDWVDDRGLVARLGGDKFAAFRRYSTGNETATQLAESLLSFFKSGFLLQGVPIELEIDVGVTSGTGKPEDLLRQAEIALFAAREDDTREWCAFDPEMKRSIHTRRRLAGHLRQAIERDEFLLHYQPQIDLRTGMICGGEALIRWQQTDFGLVSPGEFMPVAEQSKLIIPMGEWVLREACRQHERWQGNGVRAVNLSVNVSLVQLVNTDFEQTVHQILAETGNSPENITLEITETVFDQAPRRLKQQLQDLAAMGCQLSLDDFGTGYAVLRYIQEYPFSVIKLDRSFVSQVTEDSYSRAICEMVIGIGRELGADVIAEGIETEAQRDMLVELGCPQGQGFYFSRPLPPDEFRDLLKGNQPLPGQKQH